MFGVDTLGFSFPINHADTTGASAQVLNVGTEGEAITYRRKLPNGGFLAWGKGDTCWVEASLPKRQWEHNVNAVDCDTALELVEQLHAEACEFVTPCEGVVYHGREGVRADGRDWQQSAIKRLDIVRDFDGCTVGPLLDGLAGVHRTPAVKVRRFADAERGASETLRVGVRSAWSTVLYDKHAESPLIAPPGRMRFEARLRDDFLTSKRVRDLLGGTLPDMRHLRQAALATLGKERFHHVGFDRHVAGTGMFAERVNASDLTPRQKRDMIAYLAADQLGIDLGFHRNTVRRYRKLADSLGIVPGARVAPDICTGLDLETGRQVFVAEHEDGDQEPVTVEPF
jgi:hypothetical protein